MFPLSLPTFAKLGVPSFQFDLVDLHSFVLEPSEDHAPISFVSEVLFFLVQFAPMDMELSLIHI